MLNYLILFAISFSLAQAQRMCLIFLFFLNIYKIILISVCRTDTCRAGECEQLPNATTTCHCPPVRYSIFSF
jgi:hypothetical protein